MNIIKHIARCPKVLFVLFFLNFFWGSIPEAAAKSVSAPRKKSQHNVTAQAVYAIDYTNRRILCSRNPRMKFQPASTVKLLSALVVLEHRDLDDRVEVSANAVNVTPTKAGLTRGAQYSIRDLLKVLIATSANDAAVVLAEAVAGNEEKFVLLMNKKAKDIGARASHFTNATGLSDKEQVTTAYDLSIITRAAFSHPFISSVMKQKYITIQGSDGKPIRRRSHNKLLWRLSDPLILGKTGYTRAAGHCFAGIVYYDDHRISIVILKSRKPWSDIFKILGVSPKK